MQSDDIFSLIEEDVTKDDITTEDIIGDTKEIKNDDCSHENISNNFCKECGREMCSTQEYDKSWKMEQKHYASRSIYTELNQLGFPEIIIQEADKLYQKIIKEHDRVALRKFLKIACVHAAYILRPEFGAISTDTLFAKFNVNGKKAFKGFQTVSKYISKVLSKNDGPIDFVRDILKLFEQSDDHFTKICGIYDKIRNSPELDDPRPQSVSAGLVYYYILTRPDIDIPLSVFEKKVNLAIPTIRNVVQKICTILNTPEIFDKIKKQKKNKKVIN